MKYKIWDKINEKYLDLTKYCINGFGDVMTTKGIVLQNKGDFEIQVEEDSMINADSYKELLIPFMSDLKSELQGFNRDFNFDFAINNLVKRFENQKKTIAYYQEKYPDD